MPLTTVDQMIARVGNGFTNCIPLFGEQQVTTTASFMNSATTCQRAFANITLPSLPGGVPFYIPNAAMMVGSTTNHFVFLGRAINLGSFDIGNTTVGTFTDGSATPTRNCGGVSYQIPCQIWVEVTTATAGTQTAVTITYTNQDGTTGRTIVQTPATSAVVGTMNPLTLQSPDWGLRDITAVARAASSGPTGVLQFWAIQPISLLFPSSTAALNLYYWENFISSQAFAQRLNAGDEIIGVTLFGNAARVNTGQLQLMGDD